MSHQPFRPGGLVLPSHPATTVRLAEGEPVLTPEQVSAWLASQGLSEDWLTKRGTTPDLEVQDDLY